jgi:hypothetical protein
MLERGIAFITRERARPFMFYWLAAQRPHKRKKDIAKAKKMAWELNGQNNEEKENNLQTIRRGGVSR